MMPSHPALMAFLEQLMKDLNYDLRAYLRVLYNTVRLHEGIGYVTPDDEHHGGGKAIRAARRVGLAAQQQRLATNRELRKDHR